MPEQMVKAIAKGELDPITKLPFQGESGYEKSPPLHKPYEVKDFRPESNKPKLELPAQKNVLTNYFCFASLEAKRKFRAPRVSPIDLDSGTADSLVQIKHGFGFDNACKENDLSSKSLLGQMVQCDDMSPLNPLEIVFSQKETEDNGSPADGNLEQNSLEKSQRSVHKASLALSRDHDDEHGSFTASEKEDLQEQHGTIKSSYFQHNSVCKSDPSYGHDKVNMRRSYFVDKPDDSDRLGASKKVVIRSSYFKHMSKTSTSDADDRSLAKDDISVDDETDKPLQEMASVGNHYEEDLFSKRKASSITPNEFVGNKHARTDTYVEAKSAAFPTDDDNPKASIPEDEKFGCKISHLGHYSDISGKSMDKFVSVVSSFRYSSSGSRASGLRAPLKDVKNLYPNRLSAPIDINKFSFVPKSAKVKLKRGSSSRGNENR